ncbi:hypothetical protein SGLAM104S_06781 [Streptomyces glaucescens]
MIIPEYVVGHWYEHLLHNQSALRLKGRLLFTQGVMVTSVPYQLASSEVAKKRARKRSEWNAPGAVRRGPAAERAKETGRGQTGRRGAGGPPPGPAPPRGARPPPGPAAPARRQPGERRGGRAEQLKRLAAGRRPAGTARSYRPRATVPPGQVPQWRTRVQYAVDAEGHAGLRKHRSHEVQRIDHCMIAAAGVSELGIEKRDWTGMESVEAIAATSCRTAR